MRLLSLRSAPEQHAWCDHLDAARWEEGGLLPHPRSPGPLLHVQWAGLRTALWQDASHLFKGIPAALRCARGGVFICSTWNYFSLHSVSDGHQEAKGASSGPSQHVAGSVCPWEEFQLLLWGNLQRLCWDGIASRPIFLAKFSTPVGMENHTVPLLPSYSMRTKRRFSGSGGLQGWWGATDSQTWPANWNWSRSTSSLRADGSGRVTGLLTPRKREYASIILWLAEEVGYVSSVCIFIIPGVI